MRLTALALLGPAGQIERGSETFRLRYGGAAEFVQQAPELGRLLAGEVDRAAINVAGIDAALEAVTGGDGGRRALLTFAGDPSSPGSQASNALLSEPLDDSPAIVWLKDLAGRYIRVNRRYTAHLGISEDRFRGRTDAELAPRESIDGPRLQERPEGATEPLQLEYTAAPFEGRPGLAVLRFPVRDRAGQPVAVCSVASLLEQGHVAQSEAARLMEVERFSRLDADAVRTEFMREWGVVANGSGPEAAPPGPMNPAPIAGPPASDAPGAAAPRTEAPIYAPPAAMPGPEAPAAEPRIAPPPAMTPDYADEFAEPVPDLAAQRDSALAARAELGRELAHAQLKLVELESMRAQAESAHVRVEELEREVNETRARAAESEERLRADAAQVRADAERARAEAEQVRADAERARADAERARAELDALRDENERVAVMPHPSLPAQPHEPSEQEPGAELTSSLPAPLPSTPNEIRPEDEDGFDSAVRWLPPAQRKLSASLGRMSVWRTVLRETATIIGSEGGWDAVTAWVPDEHGGLACAAMWTSHPGLGDFESETWDVAQARPGSLPAQALHAPHLTWVTEIDAVDDDRLGSAAAHGMRSALLLPIRDGAATIGLLELLAHASVKPDAQIAMSLEAAALQLGQFGHLLRISA